MVTRCYVRSSPTTKTFTTCIYSPISVRHFRVTFLKAGTFKNCKDNIKSVISGKTEPWYSTFLNRATLLSGSLTIQPPHILHFFTPLHPHTTHLVDERANEFSLKDVAKGYPVEELEQGLQRGSHQGDALGVVLQGGGR